MSVFDGVPLSDWLALAALAVAIVGIPVAWIIARRTRRTPLLQYAVDFDILAVPADGLVEAGLSMKFNGNDVPVVSRTYLAFWNRSGDTVDRDDILAQDPLQIVLASGDNPLQTRIAFRSRPQIDLSSRIDNGKVFVDFLFLDAGDGGIIEVLHQGVSAPEMAGTVKGAKLQRVGGRVDLSAARIAWMSQRGLVNRFRNRFISAYTLYARRPKLAFFLPFVVAVLTVAIALYLSFQMLRTPQLVAVHAYNLATLQGQHDFSNRVQDIGQQSGGIVLILLLLVQAAAFGSSIYTTLGRRVIPRSIVTEKLPVAAR